MDIIADMRFTGERPLYGIRDAEVVACLFGEGESPLKECRNIIVRDSTFGWKYPLWYGSGLTVTGSTWEEMARAGVWYSDNVTVRDSVIHAPKNFRRCSGIGISNTTFTNAQETLWHCSGIKLSDVTVKNGDYLAMNSSDVTVKNLELDGNYAFDGGRDIEVTDSKLNTKDAFWNCSNVTVRDSYISGEYLGWNSSNLTFINCTIESSQGLCYIDNLRLINCKLINTTLAFEYSSVEADISSDIDSVLNPGQGTIRCANIGELIIEKNRVDPAKTIITATSITKQSDRPEWTT